MSAMAVARGDRSHNMAVRPASPPPPRVWPVFVTFAVVFAVLLVVLGVALATAVAGKVPRGTPPAEIARRMEAFAISPDGVMASSLITSVVLIIVALVAGAAAPEGLVHRLGLGTPRLSGRRVLLMLVGMLAISEAMGSVIDILGWSGKGALGALAEAMRQLSGPSFLALLMVVGLFAPIAEEVFFRGFIQTRLVARFGAWPGILIASLLFGLFHLDAIHTPVALVLGVFLGWAAVASGTLLLAVLLHAANNVTSVLLTAYLPDPTPAGTRLVVLGLSGAVAAAAIWRLQALPAPRSPEARPRRVGPAVVPESVTPSRASPVGWAACPHCQLRHSRRPDGRCPRCSQAVVSVPRATAARDYVLEDAGRKELNAIRVLMVVVGVLAMGVNWHARSSAVERVSDAGSAIARELQMSGDRATPGARSARQLGLLVWENPGKAVYVERRIALVGIGLGAAFLVCAARAGRRPVSATITALTLCSVAHLLFWAVGPLGGNAFFGTIDTSEPNLSAVMKVLVAIVLIKAVHTSTEYQKAVDFQRANASPMEPMA